MEKFETTQLQVRYPDDAVDGIGLYDASFAYNTLDGVPNGGGSVSWFFWPSVLTQCMRDFWKTSVSKLP
jgi:hypothetical protein